MHVLWCPPSLYLGRLYIAKQVLASLVYYHAQVIRPAYAQLQGMVGLVARFVARPARDGAGVEDPRAYMQHPQHSASSLQPLDGSVAAVDLLMQFDVLQNSATPPRSSTPRPPPSATPTVWGTPSRLMAALVMMP